MPQPINIRASLSAAASATASLSAAAAAAAPRSPATPRSAAAASPTPADRSSASGSTPDGVSEMRFKLTLPGIEGASLGTFREISGIGVEVETMDYAEGGRNDSVHRLPVRLKYQNIVLKRGITHQRSLLDWFNAVRTDGVEKKWGAVTITLMSAGSEAIQAWSFKDAYPVKWTGPTLNAASNQIASETLEIAHGGMTVV